MKHPIHKTILIIGLAILLLGATACTSTRNEGGVTIEKKRNFNVLDYIPGL